MIRQTTPFSSPVALLTGLLAGGSVGVVSAAEGRIDISDDGRITLVVTGDGAGAGAPEGAGPSVPYGAVPDWSNDLRRQIGGLQVADMNGDGLLDVVAGCYQSNSFPPYEHWYNYIYYNVGGELEADPSWISADEVSTGDVQVGFIDGDEYPDIFAANGGFAMSDSVIYFGGPGGPSTAPAWASNEAGNAWNNHAALVDLDHDGDLDVVTANQGNSPSDGFRPMYLFRNVEGTLDTTPSWQSAESSIQGFLAAGDLDGDGWEDIAASKWVNWETAVYRNTEGSLETTPTWTTGDEGDDKGVGWADVDGDGMLDLAVGHDPTQLFTNTGGSLALSWSSTATFFGQQDLRFADVDHDGDDDLAEIHFSNGHVYIYLNEDGDLASAPSWTYDSAGSGTAIAFGDIDGDSLTDLVVGNSGDVSLMVFYNQGVPCPADLDGSGAVDVDDLLTLLAAWGTPDADITGDGTTDVDDLLALLAQWGACG